TIVLDPRVLVDCVVTRPTIVRAGRTAVITEMLLADRAGGAACGYATMSSTVLSDARPQSVDPRVVTRLFNDAYVPRAASFHDELGIDDEGEGRLALKLAPFLGNSMGM